MDKRRFNLHNHIWAERVHVVIRWNDGFGLSSTMKEILHFQTSILCFKILSNVTPNALCVAVTAITSSRPIQGSDILELQWHLLPGANQRTESSPTLADERGGPAPQRRDLRPWPPDRPPWPTVGSPSTASPKGESPSIHPHIFCSILVPSQ